MQSVREERILSFNHSFGLRNFGIDLLFTKTEKASGRTGLMEKINLPFLG